MPSQQLDESGDASGAHLRADDRDGAVDERVAVSNGAAGEGLRVTGDAVEVLEALSMRRPLDQEIPADSRWMFYGLAEVFDADRN